ncbi:ATP-binding protein [Aquibacillus saliphilus]|uniref:ATP-binding protein n=1 Tax=Aquibacillus saliphilus TaxID=1909422 RepID=UPI003F711B76
MEMNDNETTDEIESFYKFVKGDIFDKIEDSDYEFKQSENPLRMIKDTVHRYICSFLNASGGRILYGITDSERIIQGLRLDSKDIDDIKLAVFDKARAVNPGISPDQLEIITHDLFNEEGEKLADEYILEIVVPALKSKNLIHYIDNGRTLVVRVNGSSRTLQGSEIVSYVLNKFDVTIKD